MPSLNKEEFSAFIRSTIEKEELKLDLDFAEKFMFSLDSDQQFCIPLEELIRWKVYTRKDNAKTTLRAQFREGVEYSCRDREIIGPGKPAQEILLSVDCFKNVPQTQTTGAQE
jgi:hypothetical protein